MDNSKEMVKLAVNALEDKKGEDIQIIDIREVSVLADYFLIASGSNTNQVQAMADNVEETLGKAGYACRQVEGYQSGNWILMDYKLTLKIVLLRRKMALLNFHQRNLICSCTAQSIKEKF